MPPKSVTKVPEITPTMGGGGASSTATSVADAAGIDAAAAARKSKSQDKKLKEILAAIENGTESGLNSPKSKRILQIAKVLLFTSD